VRSGRERYGLTSTSFIFGSSIMQFTNRRPNAGETHHAHSELECNDLLR
jgi:hypothetical protein